MRVAPAELPRRPLGLRGWLIGAAVLVVILLLSLRGLARFYTDYLWFQEVGFADTWRRLLSAKALPALIFSAFFFVFLLVNLVVADRVAPRYRTEGPEDEIIERYRTYVAPYSGRLRVAVALFFALVMGGGVSAEWRDWILFSNAVDVGIEDEQFHRDIGFYMFRLPFMQFAVGWIFAALLVVLIVTAVFHYLNGGIRIQSPWQRVTPQVKVHISVILALMALTKTAQYYLARFELVFSDRGFTDGASYTDVKAQLPALNLLMVISVAAAILFIANIWRRGWVFPIIAVGLWAFISLVVGTIYPAIIQRFVVQPNELSREEPYIERNIAATREAFRLDDDHVTVETYDYAENLDEPDVDRHGETLANIRLWDPGRLHEAFRATEEIQTFYRFADVDVDRYEVGSDERLLTLVAPRELDAKNIPDRTWTNRSLVYTHGFGAVAAAGNESVEGEPSYLLRGIDPAEGELKDRLVEPGVYFGEGFEDYAVVDTKVAEQQASGEEATEEIRYEGDAGVRVSNIVRRTALALRFWDGNLFFSGQLDGDSRVLFMRNVRERVETAAPFLRFDSDPYPVLLESGLVWVVDAYTISDRYPYSQSLHPRNLPRDSGLDTEFNYVRNSVKATVDAYDGTIRFYVVDEDDPIVRVYRRAFPELFSDIEEMPRGLQDHWRYPEDLFRAQTEQYSLYHMTDADDFFRRQALWDVAPSPEATGPVSPATTRAAGRDTTLEASGNPIAPLYLTMALPGEETQEFVLVRPYVPRRKANQLSAFMVARNDGDHYGELVVYELPENRVAPSPARAGTAIESTQAVSEQFTLLSRAGSSVLRGDVQLIPLGDAIVYVRPIYVLGEGESTFPRLRFVAVTYGERAVLADLDPQGSAAIRSVPEALAALIGDDATPPDQEPPDQEPPDQEPPDQEPPDDEPRAGNVAALLAEAAAEFQAADDALRAGGPDALAEYQRHVERAADLVEQANNLLAAGGSTTTTAPPAEPAAALGRGR
jgi:hypothetical protein